MDYQKVAGVKISPPVVEFYDAEPHIVHQMKISVQNLDKTSKQVHFLTPMTKNFRIKCKETEKFIAPGLELVALVEYYNDQEQDCEDHIVFKIDDVFVEVPLLSYAPKAALDINSSCDLGTIVDDGQVHTKDTAILNRGSKCGHFKIIVEPDAPFSVMPLEGTIHPGYSQPIRFEFVSKNVGSVDAKLKVQLGSGVFDCIQFKVNVVSRKLQILLKEKDEPVDCIKFGCTYYGCDVIQSYILYNASPVQLNFVTILDEGGEGEEIGVDVTKSLAVLCMDESTSQLPRTSFVVEVFPHEGVLAPYERMEIFFKFAPRFSKPKKGWKDKEKLPPRNDYAMFLHIQAVGFSNNQNEELKIELAVTGTALPVSLSILPYPSIGFGDCNYGESKKEILKLRNNSSDLPICYAVRKIAHFHSIPTCGFIRPEEICNLFLSFEPNQVGLLKNDLFLDLIGQVCEVHNSFRPIFKKVVLQTMKLQVSGNCILSNGSIAKKSAYLKTSSSRQFAQDSQLSSLQPDGSNDEEEVRIRIAHPNDLACSIRPSDASEVVRTQFTKQGRHTYVDPDYEFPADIREEKIAHRNKYNDIMKAEARKIRTKKKAVNFQKFNNERDLGMAPSHGLKPPKLSLKDMEKEITEAANEQKENLSRKSKLLTTRNINISRENSAKKKIMEGLNAIPLTASEREECDTILTPQELYQVVIESHVIDFGDVCKKSLSSKELKIINNLPKNIMIHFDITQPELRQTSPLSQVVPAFSVAKLELIFESPKEGRFEKSVNYTLNRHHNSHILVYANVVNVELELSETELDLTPTHGVPKESGFRKLVTLINKRNLAAQFSWSPIIEPEGTSFTIRPAKGIVEPFSSLALEVTFYPAYSAKFSGKFLAAVEGGSDLTLSCTAQVGETSCSFVERRLVFDAQPIHLLTVQSAFLKNNSHNHAFFKVLNPHPLANMTVLPKEGIVPVGGATEIKVAYRPEVNHKFDTRVDVDILGWKTISLRMGGCIERPAVDIDIAAFNFGGVYTGSEASVPFKIINLVRSNALVVFNLTDFKDFKVIFPGVPVKDGEEYDGYFHVTVQGHGIVDAILRFTPTEIASYNFTLPASLNHIFLPSPPPSPCVMSVVTPGSGKTKSSRASSHYSQPKHSDYPTARKRVIATVLRAPLQLSTHNIDFVLPSIYFHLNIENYSGRIQKFSIVNNSMEKISFSLNVGASNCKQLFDQGIFTFLFKSSTAICIHNPENNYETVELESGQTFHLNVLFSPDDAKKYEASVPVILNGQLSRPYSYIHLSGELLSPQIQFNPTTVHFDPVPLGTEAILDVELTCKDFKKVTPVVAVVPSIELDDGSSIEVLRVGFEDENNRIMKSVDGAKPTKLKCKLSFKSTNPTSFSTEIIFTAGDYEYKLPVSGTSDNCILTNYNFLSNASNNFHIVCERVKQRKIAGCEDSTETIFVPCVSPIRTPTVASTTDSTSFSLHVSSYEETILSSSSSPEEGSSATTLADPNTENDAFLPYQYVEDIFPQSDAEEGKSLKDIMKTVQRWYSSESWANGPCPINLPYSLRTCYDSNDLSDCEHTAARAGSKYPRNEKIEKRSVIDIVTHLCGKAIPGLRSVTNLPGDRDEKIQSIIYMYSSLLTFLRCQGAMVATIKPESLLDASDYRYYMTVFNKEPEKPTIPNGRSNTSLSCNINSYEALSRKAWTDLLLQIIKVLVLAKVTPQSYRKMALPDGYPQLPVFNPDPLCSNIYNVSERIILAWLNQHYEQQRAICWKQKYEGVKPPSRWIVNFENDFVDGLVLASLICAYAPYLVSSHLSDLYTHPNSAEQCLHNALKATSALKTIGLDYDILATDITEPNAVNILLLCIYLYQRLPFYLPSGNAELTTSLHTTTSKHIKLQNPSNKSILYQAVIAGQYADDFKLPQGHQIQVPPRQSVQVPVEFTSRFLRPCESTLVLCGKRIGSLVGSTLVFTLKGFVENIIPRNTIRYSSPCYELKKIMIPVKNPFSKGGVFKMVLVETDPTVNSNTDLLLPTKKSLLEKIASRTDHGLNKKLSQKKENLDDLMKNLVIGNSEGPVFSMFWSPFNTVHLDELGSKDVEIQYLPFDVGYRQCSVLFLNEEIGEFLYSIEAESIVPLPTEVPFHPDQESRGSSRVTSASAVQHSHGTLKEDHRFIYLHCEADKESLEEFNLPVRNAAKERALLVAAQQRMSEKEIKRRELTGIISVETILSAISCLQINRKAEYIHPGELVGLTGGSQKFNVTVSSPFFDCPSSLCIPLDFSKENEEIETVKLPITVMRCRTGQYSCLVTLTAPNDVRVYRIECTIKDANATIELEFVSPAHEIVVQDVPIVNHSDVDWHLRAEIEGEGFVGPSSFIANAHATSKYPLSFQPVYEGSVEGHLLLRNKSSGGESFCALKGDAIKPLALCEVQVDCIVNEQTMKVVEITNKLQHKMVFQAFSDLDMITGPSFITVLPKRTVQVPLNILTLKRGYIEGVVSFVYDAEFVTQMGLDRTNDVDSDEEDEDNTNEYFVSPLVSSEMSQLPDLMETSNFQRPYRLWYALRINSIPAAALKRHQAASVVNSTTTMELTLNNPMKEALLLDVVIDGLYLYGDACVTIPPFSSTIYQLQYSPTAIGPTKACVIFQSDLCAEFWYDISLMSENPHPVKLPLMQCTLGKSCTESIAIRNPSMEAITYSVFCSSSINFAVDCINDEVTVPAQSDVEVPITFIPSSIGSGNHKAEVIFSSEKAGYLTYIVCGRGDKPSVTENFFMQTKIGTNCSLIVSFHNPFDHDVLVDVELKENKNVAVDETAKEPDRVFRLLLKNSRHLMLPSKSALDIPISYTPVKMQKRNSLCIITTKPLITDESDKISDFDELAWTYNINGVPTCMPVKDVHAPVIECRARERIEEKIEISFTGFDENMDRYAHSALLKSLSPIHLLGNYTPPSAPDISSEYSILNDNFDYQIEYQDKETEENISRSVAVQLKRKLCHNVSGTVSLLFEVVLAATRSFNHLVYLTITSSSGGVWKYPIRFASTEPKADDVITIQSQGLNKDSKVSFRLTSQTSEPVQFEAYFAHGYDSMFTVSPSSGYLAPSKDRGTLITVSYKPAFYGKVHKSKLLIQTREFQWIYDINGVTPEYQAPNVKSATESRLPIALYPRDRKKNFVRENLRVNTTGVSSPLKGAPIIPKSF